MTLALFPTPVKPVLKWAGGKRWLIPELVKVFPHKKQPRLVEPFSGGLAVALGLMPRKALLNDINPHLINFYRQMQKGLRFSVDMRNDADLYYIHRERFNQLISENQINTVEAASLFYYLNRTGFNGLCRFNKSGFFNVPFGKYNNIAYEQDFSLYKDVFRDWSFDCGDFENLNIKAGDFIYADPPYDVEFTKYFADGFEWRDQVRLADWLMTHSGAVVVSNQATDRVLELYKSRGFEIKIVDAPRRISCNGDRTPAAEMLAFKNV